jgi:ferredoxin-NADP reductase
LSFKTFPVRVVARRMITPTALQLDLECADGTPLERIAGQFVNIHFEPHDAPGGDLIHRSYSVCNSPGDGAFSIAVAPVEGGRATAHLFGLAPGDQTLASGPYGRFVLRDEPPARHVLVGTGTGITPYRAMFPELSIRLQDSDFSTIILLGVRSREEALYADEFRAFADQHARCEFRACLSRVTAEDCVGSETSGYVQAQFDQLELDPEADLVYLCGNPDMIDHAFADLKERGFAMASVRREKYLPARS